MKMVKKVISVLVVMSMLFGTVTFAATYKDVEQTTKYFSAVSLLSSLDIIKGYEDGTFGPDKNVTRAEFSVMLVRTLGVSGIGSADPAGMTFKDISDVTWAISDIRTAYDLGIINGMSAEAFAPNDQVTYEQAIKMIVCALGYKPAALDRVGGDEALVYPNGYLSVATSNNIDSGVAVKNGQPAKRWEIAKLLYNSLEIDLMEKSLAVDTNQSVIRKGKTILSDKLRIKTGTGELKSDEATSASASGQVSKAGEVLIYQQSTLTTETYKKTRTDAKGLIVTIPTAGIVGHSIKYYYTEDINAGTKTVVHIEDKTKNSAILKINASNIDSITEVTSGTIADGVTINYWVNKETDRKTESVKLEAGSSVVINGRTATGTLTKSDLMPLSGDIELVDTSSKGFDKIFVSSYETYVVDQTTSSDKKVYDRYRPSTLGTDGKKLNEIILDEDDSQVELKIVNTSNTPVEFSSLAKWNVLTIKQTKSTVGKRIIDVVVSNKPISGSITDLDKDNSKLKIGSTSYEFSKYFETYYPDLNKLTIDDSGMFYLDKDGKVAAFDRITTRANNYGYLANVSLESDVLNFKFMLQNGTSIGSSIKGAKRIKLNGTAVADKKTEIVDKFSTEPQLVKYGLNGSGEIDTIVTSKTSSIEVGDLAGTSMQEGMTYTTSNREFTKGTTKFMVDSNTNIFIVPTNRANYDDYSKIPYSSLTNNMVRDAIAYDLGGAGSVQTAKAVVIIGDDPRATVSEQSPIAIVSKISGSINPVNNETSKKISAYIYGNGKNGEEKAFWTESDSTLTFKVGDVIRFGTKSDERIIKDNSVEVVLDASAPQKFFNSQGDSADSPIYRVGAGLLYSVYTEAPQYFEIAEVTAPSEIVSATVIHKYNIDNGVQYLKFPGTTTPEVTKTSSINMSSSDYYTMASQVDSTSKKAAQVFVYSSNGIVKVIYYYNIQE